MMLGPALLFCPADRPERFEKAAAVADHVIIDLEDAVAPADKPSAREALMTARLDPARTIVRINPAGSADFELDLAALARTPFTTVMLAKAEHAHQVESASAYDVVALIETARGVLHAPEIAAHPRTIGLMWGAEDLIASLQGRSSRLVGGGYRDVARFARASVLVAARAHGKDAIDAVHLEIADIEGLRDESEDAAASGFAGTACIHPTQVEIVRAAYASSESEREWARAVLEEAERHGGVFRFRGRMIDEPVLKQARSML